MAIRRKLILLYSGLLALMILFFGMIVFSVIRSTWVESVDSTLRETAQQVIQNSRLYPVREFGSPERLTIRLPRLDIFRASGVFVQVWAQNEDGTSRFASASENLGDFDDALDPATLGSESEIYKNIFIDGTELRILTAPMTLLGQSQLLGNVQVAASLQTVNKATNKLALVMVVTGIILFPSRLGYNAWRRRHRRAAGPGAH